MSFCCYQGEHMDKLLTAKLGFPLPPECPLKIKFGISVYRSEPIDCIIVRRKKIEGNESILFYLLPGGVRVVNLISGQK